MYKITVITGAHPKLRNRLQQAYDNGAAGSFQMADVGISSGRVEITFERELHDDEEYIEARLAAGAVSREQAAQQQLAAEFKELGGAALQPIIRSLELGDCRTSWLVADAKKFYIEAGIDSADLMSGGVGYVQLAVDQALVNTLTRLRQICLDNSLSTVAIDYIPTAWGPGDTQHSCNLAATELVVDKDDFHLRTVNESGDQISSVLWSINEFLKLASGGVDTAYLASRDDYFTGELREQIQRDDLAKIACIKVEFGRDSRVFLRLTAIADAREELTERQAQRDGLPHELRFLNSVTTDAAVRQAFRVVTGLNDEMITGYSEDDLYAEDGELILSGDTDEPTSSIPTL